MRSKKEKKAMFLLVILLFVTIGYALLSQRLDINGISKIDKATWKIHWDNVTVTEGSITGNQVTQAATIANEEQTLVEYSINLKKPKEFYEFTVDAVNEGTIDGMIDVITNKAYEADGVTEREIPNYLTYTVTYGDDYEIDEKHLLKSGEAETYKVRIEFKDISDALELPQSEDTIIFKFNVDYTQADETGEERDRYSPFTTNFSLDGLSLMSYDIDYDKCMEEASSWITNEEQAQTYCRGEDIDDNGYTYNINQDIIDDTSYFEENGIIKNKKYGKMESYEINYEGCKNYLTNNGETDEEQIELFCTGNTATVFGDEQNLNEKIQEYPESVSLYEALGVVTATYTESKPDLIITGYEEKVPKELVIPSKINGRVVIGIAEAAFRNKNIISLELPSTIEFVEIDAFNDNNLNKVNIKSNNIELGNCAFGNISAISDHNIPNSYECVDLSEFYIGTKDNNNKYRFIDGMTWGDWLNSKYANNSNATLSNVRWFEYYYETQTYTYHYFNDNKNHVRAGVGESPDSYICNNEMRSVGYYYIYGNNSYVAEDDLIIKDYVYELNDTTMVC